MPNSYRPGNFMDLETLVARYPSHVTLPDNTAVEVRFMRRGDADTVTTFAKSLPAADLMFLRLDITDDETLEGWIQNIEKGLSTTLLAMCDGKMIGYASVHRDPVPWTRRVGEIRINLDPSARNVGLGRVMISQIFDLARAMDIKKLIANMTDDQIGARAALRRLGFMPEAVLADHVEDRNGRLHDLVVMAYDIDGLSDHIDEPIRL